MPTRFLINPAFDHQMYMNKSEDIITTDDYGYLNIPDDHHFYFMMDNTTLYMVTARRNDIAKTQMSIDFHSLKNRRILEE